jgi:hypothetical protein
VVSRFANLQRIEALRYARATPVINSILRLVAFLVFWIGLFACASVTSQENFRNGMKNQIGKSVDDPSVYFNRYPEMRMSSKTLSNGNLEEGIRIGRHWECHVYFEIDKTTREIVRWRSEGSDDVCAINR